MPMAPLRLQIVVQPRPWPAASKPAASESTIKWLEICHGDPTIQELSETLEARFFERNHAPLDIKILKFLDDVELYPSYKLRDVFEDIKDAKDGERSFSTVKVFRNPPTTAELADTKRFESLPPESLARPQKRPLPALFADSMPNDYAGNFHRLRSPLRRSLVYPDGPNKRQKVNETGQQSLTDPDELVQSLEVTNDFQNPSSVAAQRLSPVQQVEDSQKSPQRKRSDPYGTPVSSQAGQHEGVPSQLADVTSAFDSPRITRSTSPEIPLSVDESPDQEPPAQTRSLTQALQVNQLPGSSQAIRTTISIPNPRAAHIPLSVSLETPLKDSSLVQPPADVSKPASPKPQSTPGRVGQLQRPKTFQRKSDVKRTRKAINGILQSTPSVFDPIDTSEGSSQERELLRSGKKPKITIPPRTKTGIEAPQTIMPGKSPGGRFLIPQMPPPVSELADPAQKTSEERSSSAKKQTSSEVFPERDAAIENAMHLNDNGDKSDEERGDTDSRTGKTLQRSDQLETVAKPAGSPPDEPDSASARISSSLVCLENPISSKTPIENSSTPKHPNPGNDSQIVGMPGSPSELSTDEALRLELQEAEEIKRQAQATFDRIAARSAAQKERNERSRKNQEEKNRSASLAFSEGVSGVEKLPDESNNLSIGHPIPIQRPTLSGPEATRKYHLEHFLPRVRRQFGLPEPADQAPKPRVKASTSSKKEKPPKPEPKRHVRRTRSQVQKDEVINDQQIIQDDRQTETQSVTGQETEESQTQSRKPHSQREKGDLERIATNPDKRKQQAIRYQMESIKFGEPRETAESQKTTHRPVEGKEDALEASVQQVEKRLTQEHDPDPNTNRVEASKLISINAPLQSSDPTETEEGTAASKETPIVNKQGGLGGRSPKARLNAERQIQLANQWLKNKKEGSTKVGSFNSKALLNGIDRKTPALSRPQVRPPLKKPATGQNSGSREPDQKASVAATRFTDRDALKAAGIDTGMPTSSMSSANAASSTIPPGILKKSSTIDLTELGLSSRRDSARTSSVQGHRSSQQPDDQTSSDDVRTMTPVIPSTSMKSDSNSAEVKAVSAQQTASVASRLSKTPMRSALRTTPNALRRSVSFATEPTSSSQPMSTAPTPAVQVRPKGKGMFYRALEEDANRLESLAQTSAAGKIKGRPVRKRQTKMTQHLQRDLKQKGKEVVWPAPRSFQAVDTISLSSASEASTFFSDESEGTRNSRAGPSSRERGKSRSSLATGSSSTRTSQPRALDTSARSILHGLSDNLGDGPRSSATTVVKKERGDGAAEEPKLSKTPLEERSDAASHASIPRKNSALARRRFSKPSLPESISDASSESDAESNDSLSLLPATTSAKGTMLKADHWHRSGPEAAWTSVKHAKIGQDRSRSTVQAPRTPKNQTEESKAARLARDRQSGVEAEQQLLREHNQAIQAAASAKVQDEKTKKTGGTGFEISSLKKLREAQRAQPIVMQRANASNLVSNNKGEQSFPEDWTSSSGSSNESSSNTSDSLEPAQLEAKLRQKATPSKPKGLTKALKEIFGGRP